jgi:hypothetical protein
MDMANSLLNSWSQVQANNLVFLLVAIVLVVLVLRLIVRAALGVLFFRLRHIIIAFLVSVAGGIPAAGLGGVDAIAGAGGSLRQGLCNSSYAAAAWLNDSSISSMRTTGRWLYSNTSQVCGWY